MVLSALSLVNPEGEDAPDDVFNLQQAVPADQLEALLPLWQRTLVIALYDRDWNTSYTLLVKNLRSDVFSEQDIYFFQYLLAPIWPKHDQLEVSGAFLLIQLLALNKNNSSASSSSSTTSPWTLPTLNADQLHWLQSKQVTQLLDFWSAAANKNSKKNQETSRPLLALRFLLHFKTGALRQSYQYLQDLLQQQGLLLPLFRPLLSQQQHFMAYIASPQVHYQALIQWIDLGDAQQAQFYYQRFYQLYFLFHPLSWEQSHWWRRLEEKLKKILKPNSNSIHYVFELMLLDIQLLLDLLLEREKGLALPLFRKRKLLLKALVVRQQFPTLYLTLKKYIEIGRWEHLLVIYRRLFQQEAKHYRFLHYHSAFELLAASPSFPANSTQMVNSKLDPSGRGATLIHQPISLRGEDFGPHLLASTPDSTTNREHFVAYLKQLVIQIHWPLSDWEEPLWHLSHWQDALQEVQHLIEQQAMGDGDLKGQINQKKIFYLNAIKLELMLNLGLGARVKQLVQSQLPYVFLAQEHQQLQYYLSEALVQLGKTGQAHRLKKQINQSIQQQVKHDLPARYLELLQRKGTEI